MQPKNNINVLQKQDLVFIFVFRTNFNPAFAGIFYSKPFACICLVSPLTKSACPKCCFIIK
jgi:hypothetical protein